MNNVRTLKQLKHAVSFSRLVMNSISQARFSPNKGMCMSHHFIGHGSRAAYCNQNQIIILKYQNISFHRRIFAAVKAGRKKNNDAVNVKALIKLIKITWGPLAPSTGSAAS